MTFTRAVIICSHGADKVMLFTDLPDACWPYTGKLSLDFNAAQGTGQRYVREHFGLEAEVIART